MMILVMRAMFIYGYAECNYSECRYVESRYNECRGAAYAACWAHFILAKSKKLVKNLDKALSNIPRVKANSF